MLVVFIRIQQIIIRSGNATEIGEKLGVMTTGPIEVMDVYVEEVMNLQMSLLMVVVLMVEDGILLLVFDMMVTEDRLLHLIRNLRFLILRVILRLIILQEVLVFSIALRLFRWKPRRIQLLRQILLLDLLLQHRLPLLPYKLRV